MSDMVGPPPRRLAHAFWAALAVYFFVLPVAGTTALRYIAFVVLLGATAALMVRDRQLPELPFAKCWLAYFLVALASVFFAVDAEMSWSELRVEVIYWIAIFVVGVTWGRQLPAFAKAVFLLAAINAILSLLAFEQASLGMPLTELMRVHRFAYAGMDGNWLLLVVFFEGWLAWQLWQQRRLHLCLVLLLLIALDVWAMMATQNRQNLVALAAGVGAAAMLLLWHRFSWRRAAALGAVASLALALVAVQFGRHTELPTQAPAAVDMANSMEKLNNFVPRDVRWDLWKFSLERIAEHPWVGGGIGRGVFDKLYPEFKPDNWALWHAHNMVLNKGIQMGIPGILAFVALWLGLALELLRHAGRSAIASQLAIAGLAAMTAIFVKNMTDDFFVRNVALYFWLVMGLLVGFLRSQARLDTRPG